MIDDYFLSIIFAGFIYIITPGPVFLASVTLISEGGRLKVLKFWSGAICGCTFWLVFTSISLIEANRLPSFIFQGLTLLCAAYLFFLAYKMCRYAKDTNQKYVFKRPMIEGFALGLLNPKSYPVMVSVFSAIILNKSDMLTWEEFPFFFMAAVLGFLCGYAFMLIVFGASFFQNKHHQYRAIISYLFSAIYAGFGIHLLITSVL